MNSFSHHVLRYADVTVTRTGKATRIEVSGPPTDRITVEVGHGTFTYETNFQQREEADAAPTGEGPPMPVRASTEIRFLLWSNRYQKWWAPKSRGYTHDIDQAGRYTEAEAIARVVKSAYHGRKDYVTCMVADVSPHRPSRPMRITPMGADNE